MVEIDQDEMDDTPIDEIVQTLIAAFDAEVVSDPLVLQGLRNRSVTWP